MADNGAQGELEHAAGRGGAFFFSPVGARPVFAPERFTDEQRLFYKTARDFVLQEVLPHAEKLEHKDHELWRSLLGRAGELGLLMVDIAEEYGGAGGDKVTSSLPPPPAAADGPGARTFAAPHRTGTLAIAA